MSLALDLWQAGVGAVGGSTSVSAVLATGQIARPDHILAVGKAAGAMTQAALTYFPNVPALVVTKDGHGDGLPVGVTLIEAAHPVPDARSLAGGSALQDAIAATTTGTRLLVLVSGGASSLAEKLRPGKTLDDLAQLNRRLLSSGRDITEMNTERRKISAIKGGGLLSGFQGAAVDVLAISDVPGDDIAVIGSGIGAAPDPCPFAYDCHIVASNAHAREAAARLAAQLGCPVHLNEQALHDDLDVLVARWGPVLRDMEPGVAILGGEPTVVLPDNPGRGGRNQALALALAREIEGIDGIEIVVGGTDGSDGPTHAAGGIVNGTTWQDKGAEALARADSGTFLAARDALLETGPTGTNVMDLLIAVKS
ncbi:MAG: glycerate kinase [Arenibacterium sp.]